MRSSEGLVRGGIGTVKERGKERERKEHGGGKESGSVQSLINKRERENRARSVCVCVCVCVRLRRTSEVAALRQRDAEIVVEAAKGVHHDGGRLLGHCGGGRRRRQRRPAEHSGRRAQCAAEAHRQHCNGQREEREGGRVNGREEGRASERLTGPLFSPPLSRSLSLRLRHTSLSLSLSPLLPQISLLLMQMRPA